MGSSWKCKTDLAGRVFGRLTVLTEAPRLSKRRWCCRCSCGTDKIVGQVELLNGQTQSCGCYRRERTGDVHRTHGLRRVPEYTVWVGMRKRCLDQAAHNYEYYGGRGITVAAEWLDFAVFYADMGPRPSPLHSIEREDNNGPYAKGNCRWATASEQASNRRPRQRGVSL